MEENITVEGATREEVIKIGAEGKALLASGAKWAKFIAIVTIVCIGIGLIAIVGWILAIAVAGFSMYDMSPGMGAMSGIYGAMMMPIMIFCVVIYVAYLYAAIYLYRFAVKAEAAVLSNNESVMAESLFNLKRHFKISGIILITSLAFGVLFMVGAIVAGIAMAV
jgi:hypothetical protein